MALHFSDISGPRIDLVKVSMNGLNDMHEYSINPDFYQYLEYEPFKTIDDSRQYLEKLIEMSKTQNDHFWFIRLKNENKIVGTFGVRNINQRRQTAEIGYGVSPLYWNQGIFRETLETVMDYLFNKLNFFRISAITRFDNLPSIKTLTNLGFIKEGVFRKYYLSYDNHRYDAILFSILKDDFTNHLLKT